MPETVRLSTASNVEQDVNESLVEGGIYDTNGDADLWNALQANFPTGADDFLTAAPPLAANSGQNPFQGQINAQQNQGLSPPRPRVKSAKLSPPNLYSALAQSNQPQLSSPWQSPMMTFGFPGISPTMPYGGLSPPNMADPMQSMMNSEYHGMWGSGYKRMKPTPPAVMQQVDGSLQMQMPVNYSNSINNGLGIMVPGMSPTMTATPYGMVPNVDNSTAFGIGAIFGQRQPKIPVSPAKVLPNQKTSNQPAPLMLPCRLGPGNKVVPQGPTYIAGTNGAAPPQISPKSSEATSPESQGSSNSSIALAKSFVLDADCYDDMIKSRDMFLEEAAKLDVEDVTVVELKRLLKKFGLNSAGKKESLLDRIQQTRACLMHEKSKKKTDLSQSQKRDVPMANPFGDLGNLPGNTLFGESISSRFEHAFDEPPLSQRIF